MHARFDKAPDTDVRSFVSLSALRASLWRLRRELLGIRIEKNLWHPGLTIQNVMVFSFRHYLCVRPFSIKRYVRPTDRPTQFSGKKELRRDKIRWSVALHKRHNIPFFLWKQTELATNFFSRIIALVTPLRTFYTHVIILQWRGIIQTVSLNAGIKLVSQVNFVNISKATIWTE